MSEEMDIIIVEDGTVVEDANSYVDYDFVEKYHKLMGNSAWLNPELTRDEKQCAIIRATKALDGLYNGKWLGVQVKPGEQSLQFPRSGISIDEVFLPSDVIPKPVKFAVCEFALKELQNPNGILADQERGGDIRRVKADTVEVEYQRTASSNTSYKMVDGLIAAYVSGTSSSDVGSGNVDINW